MVREKEGRGFHSRMKGIFDKHKLTRVLAEYVPLLVQECHSVLCYSLDGSYMSNGIQN